MAAQYAGLLSEEEIAPLSADPFAEVPSTVATAKWIASTIALPDGNSWNFRYLAPRPIINMGAYALYIDVDVQVRKSPEKQ